MGGMIAQVFAARFKHRTNTLAVIFSSNNQPLLPPPGPAQLKAILQKPKGSSREAIIENAISVSKTIGSPGYPKPGETVRAEAIEGYERSYYPAGIGRHFAAILGTGSLLGYDRQIEAPTVVIHGRADKLMRPSGGRAVVRAIRGARLVLFDGMGHELPEQLWDDIIGELKTTFAEVT
jgi:pimeloyl-ACP methyl ester carboxylesterase